MKRKNLILLILVMSVTLLALLTMQLYWIQSASSIKEASFKRSVYDAMAKVVLKLELLEKRKASQLPSYGGLLNVGPHLDYEEFVTPDGLDSIISLEFTRRGIDTRFEFGIYKPETQEFLVQKTGNYQKQLIQKGYAYSLFSSDIFSPPEYLLVWFPNERQFLLTELWGMLLISIILIVIIVYSFAWTVTSLVRQKKLSEMKNDFINNMTHEFKTPISTISLACEALSDANIKKDEYFYANHISMIREENSRLALLSEKILQSAVIEKGQLKMKKEMVDIHSIIREVIRNLRIQVEVKDGIIFTELRANPAQVEGDKVHLTNLVYNLLDNANKYSPKKPVIRMQTENAEKGILFSIEDNGIGISKTDQKKVFDKLYRVHTGDIHGVRGFGLGLSYVKAIVEEHHGKISITSEVNQGSIFSVYLPYRIPE